MTLDLRNVAGFTPLDTGIYTLVIMQAEETVAKSSGNPMLKLTMQEPATKKRIWDNIVLTEVSAWKQKEFFDAIGFDTTDIVSLDDVNNIIGLEVTAEVAIRKDNQDRDQNYIKAYLS